MQPEQFNNKINIEICFNDVITKYTLTHSTKLNSLYGNEFNI